MLNKFRKNYAILFGILMIVLFKISQAIGALPLSLIFKSNLASKDSFASVFLVLGFPDLFVILVMLFILWKTDHLYLLKKKGKGFIRSLSLSAYPIATSILYLGTGLLAVLALGARSVTVLTIVMLLLCMLVIAIAEELTCRAIVAETLLEHFGSERAGVIKACVISGILFGLMHSLNPGNPTAVFVNCITAGVGGITYAIIYFRSGNLPLLIFIHALNDIAVFGTLLLANTPSSASVNPNTNFFGLFLIVPELLVILFLMRKKKIGEVQEQWEEELSE